MMTKNDGCGWTSREKLLTFANDGHSHYQWIILVIGGRDNITPKRRQGL